MADLYNNDISEENKKSFWKRVADSDTVEASDVVKQCCCVNGIPDSQRAVAWKFMLSKLVDEEGWGWFGRHFHRAMQFALAHPDLVHKNYAASAGKLDKLFDHEWRSKVLQYQTESLSTLTEGAWTIRFDDMIADALELGPLRCKEPELPAELAERLEQIRPEKMPSNILPTLVAYYLANRPEDSDWVVLPVTNFDCYFGNTNFGRKYLNQLPQEVIERSNSFGISRDRVREEYLPK